jgi:GNAT superfamily N-acetyltransferase
MEAIRADRQTIASLRREFLEEQSFQIRYEACHSRGWADYYLLKREDTVLGYGAIKGQEIAARDTIFEFFLLAPFRSQGAAAFASLIAAAQPRWIECQSNDVPLLALLGSFGQDITAQAILFEAATPTSLQMPDVTFRRRSAGEPVFVHRGEPEGSWVLEQKGEIVATGDFLTHYNAPFVDLHMEVVPARRRQGLGSFLVQELIAECRRQGLTAAARCDMHNAASIATLSKAGMRPVGLMLRAALAAAPTF